MRAFDFDKLRNHDQAEWEALVRFFQKRLYQVAVRFFFKQDEEIEDIVQETFLVAYTEICCKGQEIENLTAWLYTICINRCRDRLRRSRRNQISLEELQLPATEPGFVLSDQNQVWRLRGVQACFECLPSDEIRALVLDCLCPYPHDTIETLMDSINRCSLPLRGALILRYIAGLKYEEIAELLNIPLGTIKKRLYLGTPRLRQDLTNKGIQPWGIAKKGVAVK